MSMTDETKVNSKVDPIAARDDNRKLALLVAINKIPFPTEKDLIEATSIPKRCVHSTFKAMAVMQVVVKRVNGRKHGYYEIEDEGGFNLERAPGILKLNYPDILQQIEDHARRKEFPKQTQVRDSIIAQY